jgi:hypothetical protein
VDARAFAKKKNIAEGKNPDNSSKAALTEKTGEIAYAQVTRDCLSWLCKNSLASWKAHKELLQCFLEPARVSLHLGGEKLTAKALEWMRAAPPSLKATLPFVKILHRGQGKAAQVLKGLLASPPTAGIDFSVHVMAPTFGEEWTEYLQMLRDEVPEKEAAQTADDDAEEAIIPPRPFASKHKPEAPAKEDSPDTRDSLNKEALDVAQQCIDGYVMVTHPDSWSKDALAAILIAQKMSLSNKRLVGFWYTSADEDARIHGRASYYSRDAPVNVDRLKSFCTAMNEAMHEQRDLCIIACGKVPNNRACVQEIIKTIGWRKREQTWHYKEDEMDQLRMEGTVRKNKKKRVFKGFATAIYTEDVFICWKGRRVPAIAEEFRVFVNPGSRVASSIMSAVPVVSFDDLPRACLDAKAKIFAGSSWCAGTDEGPGKTGLHEGPGQTGLGGGLGKTGSDNSSNISEESSPESGEQPSGGGQKRREKKRGRALTRTPSRADVPLLFNPPHPSVLQEICHSFAAGWLCLGTPEAGVSMVWSMRRAHATRRQNNDMESCGSNMGFETYLKTL